VTTATQERRFTSLHAFSLVLVLAIVAPLFVDDAALAPGLTTTATVFVAVCVQALPFLVLGVVLSGALAAFVPPGVLQRLLPARPAAAVPAAGAAGLVRPGWCCRAASAPRCRWPAG
jgi:uncharacterized protein